MLLRRLSNTLLMLMILINYSLKFFTQQQPLFAMFIAHYPQLPQFLQGELRRVQASDRF